MPVPHVAVVTLDRPPVNALSRPFREKFVETFDALNDRDDVRAIVLSTAVWFQASVAE
jgi:enoyl-CoA hydratase